MTITNTGSTAIDGWTLVFAFAAGQRVTAGWSATWGSFTTTNPAPTGFTLSGAACTTG